MLIWPTAWDERTTDAQQLVQQVRDANPLYNRVTNEIIRQYDIAEYCNMLYNITDLEAFLADENNLVPYNIWKLPDYAHIVKLRNFIDTGMYVCTNKDLCEENLCWLYQLTDDAGNTYTGPIKKGAWVTDAVDNNWELQFRFAPEQFSGYDTALTLQIGVNNDIV